MKNMKTSLLITLSLTTAFAFIGSYFLNLTADNIEQYIFHGTTRAPWNEEPFITVESQEIETVRTNLASEVSMK